MISTEDALAEPEPSVALLSEPIADESPLASDENFKEDVSTATPIFVKAQDDKEPEAVAVSAVHLDVNEDAQPEGAFPRLCALSQQLT